MLLKNLNMLCTKVELKKSKEGNQYLMLSFLDMQSGDIFDIIEKENLELMGQVSSMQKYNIDLNLSSNKYGISLKIEKVNNSLGSI